MTELDLRVLTASIGGFVSDAETELPVHRARIEILSGPEEFEAARRFKQQALSAWEWKRRPERIDRTQSRKDGSYFFANLSPGRYHLRCSARTLSFKYAPVEIEAVDVQAVIEDEAPKLAMTDFEMKPLKPE